MNAPKRKPDVIQLTEWGGFRRKFELFLADSFGHLDLAHQAYGILLDDEDKILIVSEDGSNWILPGGEMKKGETYEQTLTREVYEEAAVVLSEETIKPLFYQKGYLMVKGNWEFTGDQLRYTARIQRKDKFIADPDEGDINFQKYVAVADLHKFLKWGVTTKFIQENLSRIIK